MGQLSNDPDKHKVLRHNGEWRSGVLTFSVRGPSYSDV